MHGLKTKNVSDRYIKRCHRTLKSLGAPLTGWFCIRTYDVKEEGWNADTGNLADFDDAVGLFKCELCGCEQVRFVHVMHHEKYFEDISVGCICAGVMEDDILAAAERERVMRNRYNRKKNYLKLEWCASWDGNHTLQYKGKQISIIRNQFDNGGLGIVYRGKSEWCYKDKKIKNFLTAVHAAFDIADPLESGIRP